jgi:glycogen debranching enzyme
VSATDPSFSPEEVVLFRAPRYWRGATWINSAWLVWLGLVRLGYRQQAEELVARLVPIVRRERLREYYQPYTGRGMGAYEFGWSSLIMEMIDPDPTANSSYLLRARTA